MEKFRLYAMLPIIQQGGPTFFVCFFVRLYGVLQNSVSTPPGNSGRAHPLVLLFACASILSSEWARAKNDGREESMGVSGYGYHNASRLFISGQKKA